MECFCDLTFNKRLGFLEPVGYNSSSEASKLINALTTAHKYMSRCETGFQVWRFFLTPFAKKLFEACDVLDKWVDPGNFFPKIWTSRRNFLVIPSSFSVIGKYVRQAQCKLRIRKSHSEESSMTERSPVLEKLLVNEGIHPDDICTMLMDMIILGIQAVRDK